MGVYLGSQLPVDAVPGRTGQDRANPGVALDRVFFNRIWCPEIELFSYFFETFFKTCIKGVRQWVVKSEAVFETCIKGVRQWQGKSDDFPCFPGRGKPAASKSRSLDTSTVPTNCMKGTAQMLVLLGKHDLHKVLVRSRTCANGFQRTLRGRSEPLRGRSEGAQRRAGSLRRRSEDAKRTFRGAQRTLRERSEALRGRSEDSQRTFRGRSEGAQRTRRGCAEAFRGRSEDVQRTLRGAQRCRSGLVVLGAVVHGASRLLLAVRLHPRTGRRRRRRRRPPP